jgi:polyisoprenoid-binding protein YceI
MTARVRIDPGQSQLSVQAFATGMLSMLGHSPTFAVRVYSGEVRVEGPEAQGLAVDLTVRAESLQLVDRVSPSDRAEIESRLRREVLETAGFPEITFRTVESEADRTGEGRYNAFLGGLLTIHGVTQRHGIDVELRIEPGRLRLCGSSTVRMSGFRIRPVSAVGGAIKLKDELKVTFDLLALPSSEAS